MSDNKLLGILSLGIEGLDKLIADFGKLEKSSGKDFTAGIKAIEAPINKASEALKGLIAQMDEVLKKSSSVGGGIATMLSAGTRGIGGSIIPPAGAGARRAAGSMVPGYLLSSTTTSRDGVDIRRNMSYMSGDRRFRVSYSGEDMATRTVTSDDFSQITRNNQLYKEQAALISRISQLKMEAARNEGQLLPAAQERLDRLSREYELNKEMIKSRGSDFENTRAMAELDKKMAESEEKAAMAREKSDRAGKARELVGLYSQQYKLISDIGKLERDSITAGPGEKGVISTQIQAARREEEVIQGRINALAREGVADTERQAEAQRRVTAETDKTEKARARDNDQLKKGISGIDTMQRTMVAMATVYAMRMLRDTWRSAIGYVKQYYDYMNEIRIVTGYTEQQASELGSMYRELAEAMGVSSVDIAKMGATLYRQGLQGDEEVIGRMKAVIKYAKIANEEVDTSADIITVAVNTFKRSGEEAADAAMRVVDVWSFMGDSVATQAGEIGRAMQKVVANAKVVGLSLEKTSSYIATISATTRETPEVVGTALNRIISRYEKITKTGMNKIFTSEDGESVAVNDVAKALDAIGVSLYTAGEGFMSFGDVLDNVGARWSSLADAEKRYLATQMAGIHGINKFYALMENYQTSLDLHDRALQAAGTADQKYAVYMESLQKAQDDLKNSLEALYASLLKAGTMKSAYNMFAGFIDTIKDGINAFGGLNVKAIALVATIGSLVLAVSKFVTAFKKAEAVTALGKIGSMISGSSFKAILAAVAAISVAVVGIVGLLNKSKGSLVSFEEQIGKINDQISEAKSKKGTFEDFLATLNDLSERQAKGENVSKEYASTMERMATSTMGWGTTLKNYSGEWISLAEATELAKKRTEEYADVVDGLTTRKAVLEIGEAYKSYTSTSRQQEIFNTFKDQGGVEQYISSALSWGKDAAGRYDYTKLLQVGEEFARARKYAEAIASLIKYEGETVTRTNSGFMGLERIEYSEEFIKALRKWAEENKMVFPAIQSELEKKTKETIDTMADSLTLLLSGKGSAAGEALRSLGKEDFISKAIVEMFLPSKEVIDGLKSEEEFSDLVNETSYAVIEFISDIADGVEESVAKLDRFSFEKLVREMFGDGTDAAYEVERVISGLGLEGILVDAYMTMMAVGVPEGSTSFSDWLLNLIAGGDMGALEDEVRKFSDLKTSLIGSIQEIIGIEVDGDTQGKMDEYILTPQGIVALSTANRLLKESGITAEQFNQALSSSQSVDEFSAAIARLAENAGLAGEEITNLSILTQEADKKFTEFLNRQYADASAYDDAQGLFALLQGAYDMLGEDGSGKSSDAFKGAMAEIDAYIMNLDKSARTVLHEMFPALMAAWAALRSESVDSLETIGDAIDESSKEFDKFDVDKLDDAVSKFEATGKAVDGLGSAIKDMRKGGLPAMNAIKKLTDGVKSLGKAQGAVNHIQENGNKNTKETAEAYELLSQYTGIAVEDLENSLAPAIDIIDANTANLLYTMDFLTQQMLQASDVTFDASNWQSELRRLAAESNDTAVLIQLLANALLSMDGASLQAIADGKGNINWKATLGKGLKNTPKAKRGGGGGGGGGKKDDEITSITQALQDYLDKLEAGEKLGDFVRSMIELNKTFHEQRGELTAVITLMGQEIAHIEKMNKADEEAEKTLREKMEARQAEVATLSKSSKEYAQAALDLEALQSKHQDYSKRLQENKNDLDSLQRSMREYRNRIRELEIDLRDTIAQGFNDRDDLQRQMLDSRVEMEETILNTIRDRYQKEWDLVKEDSDRKRKAYNEEIRLMKEKLQQRKKAAEQDKKYDQLRDYESQLAAISADPTRARDREELLKKIASLREDLAWQAAEKEVESQEKSIQQQIESLDRYLEYINKFYEDMFEHPQELIAEMNGIMQGSNEEMREWLEANYIGFTDLTAQQQEDAITKMYQMAYATDEQLMVWLSQNITGFAQLNEETQRSLMSSVRQMAVDADKTIIDWLRKNNEEFKNTTEMNQQLLAQGWEGTLLSMHGVTVTYWSEIEEIIKQGDDAIIKFLMDNVADYRVASQLQAEAYVDEWKKKLDDLRAAYRDTHKEFTDLANQYTDYIQKPPSQESSGSGSGSGGKTTKPKAPTDFFIVGPDGRPGSGPYKTEAAAKAALALQKDKQKKLIDEYNLQLAMSFTSSDRQKAQNLLASTRGALDNLNKSTIKGFSEGGLVPYTGLAMVHGTRSDPEAFLSARDTRMIREMVDALQRISVPSMPHYSFNPSGQGGGMNIESITIQVEKLDSDRDMEEMAQEVMRHIYREMTIKSGTPIGGAIRY